MADPTQQMQQLLNIMEKDFRDTNTAAQQLSAALLQAARSGNAQTNAATATANAMASAAARTQAVSAGLSTIGGVFLGLVNQSTVLTAGIYNTNKAFSSVIPTLDALTSISTKVVTGLGQLGSGVAILGTTFGAASTGAATLINSGIDTISNILKFQIEASQKVADGFNASVKAGALFGGSIQRLANSAAEVFVPMQNLVKIITDNVDSLSKFGIGQEKAGLLVAGMSKQIFNGNESLRAMYGDFNSLASGVADYLELQSQLGINVKNDYRINKEAAIEYLFRQKELSAITGKNAELLKKEEQARRTQLDYNLKLGRLGEVAKANVAEGMALSGKLFGDMGAKYAQEYFATGGKVISKEMLTFAATNAEAADAIAQLMGNVNQSAEGFRAGNAAYLQAAAPALEAYARSMESMAELNRAANNPILRGQTETGAAIMENLTLLRNLGDQYAVFLADRLKRTTEPLDAPTKAYADAQKALLDNQLEIDKIVMKNMQGMSTIINMLNQVQQGFISMQGAASEALASMIKTGLSSKDQIDQFLKLLIKTITNRNLEPGTSNRPPPESPPAPQSPPAGPTSSNTPQTNELPAPAADAQQRQDQQERQASLQTEIENLNKTILALATRTTERPGDEEKLRVMAAMLAELRDSSAKLDRLRDALA